MKCIEMKTKLEEEKSQNDDLLSKNLALGLRCSKLQTEVCVYPQYQFDGTFSRYVCVNSVSNIDCRGCKPQVNNYDTEIGGTIVLSDSTYTLRVF